MLLRSRISAALGFCLVAGLAASPANAVDVSLEADADNCLYEESDNSNGQGIYLFAGLTAAGNLRRSVIHFDVSSIPAAAIITDVSLTLRKNRGSSTTYTFTLQRMTTAWGEGDSDAGEPGGLGAPAQEGDTTWDHAMFPGTLWATPGGDFEATISGSADVAGSGPYVFTGAGLVDDVQGWVDGSLDNYGWMLRGNESAFQSATRFDSRHNTLEPPVLDVTYMMTIPTETSSWSVVKERFRP